MGLAIVGFATAFVMALLHRRAVEERDAQRRLAEGSQREAAHWYAAYRQLRPFIDPAPSPSGEPAAGEDT